MNDLREKIAVALSVQFSDRTMSECVNAADRILALLPTPEAEAKLPEGVEIRLLPYHRFDVRTKTHYLTKDHLNRLCWLELEQWMYHVGIWDTHADALAAALKAPPVPKVEKPDPRKIAPNGRAMVRYRMRNDALYGLDDEQVWWWFWQDPTASGRWRKAYCPKETDTPCTFDGSPLPQAAVAVTRVAI